MSLRHAPKLRSTCIAFVLSLLVHVVAGLILLVQTIPPPAPVFKRPAPSTPIPLLSQKELRKLRQIKAPKAQKEKEKKREKSAQRRKQIVEIPPPPVERVPSQSRFLAEFNSAVKQETVHRLRRAPQSEMKKSDRRSLSTGKDEQGRRKGKRTIQSKPSRQTNEKPRITPKKGRSTQKKTSKNKQKKVKKNSISKELKQGEGPFKNQQVIEVSSEDAQYGRPQGKQSGRGRRLSPTHYQSLLPTLGPKNQARFDGSLDHIENMKRADQTALNTTEYRYAFFFNRVKRAVSARWRPANELMRLDPRGQVYGVRDRETIIAVTLRPNGSIVKVEINKASGIPQLDREALSAFLRAQPFHNPPSGLIEEDGMIRFKFGFYLEIGSRRFRLFR